MEEKNIEIGTEQKRKEFSRETARKALENLKVKIKEANKRNDFIYEIKKVVLFGSYINSNKEKIGDIDIALYIDLKDKITPETEQNYKRSFESGKQMSYLERLFYGKEEISKFVKDRKAVIELHDGYLIDKRVEETGLPNYIYTDINEVIYELKEKEEA